MTQAPMQTTLPDQRLPWQHAFAGLGERFFVELEPSALPAPQWVSHNAALGASIGLPSDWAESKDWLQALSGSAVLPGSRPLASVYSGHQFGVWAGQLGDGRALLLGELGGMELQLKGAGLTPFSRMGDGRAVLRSSIREYLCSEAMHGLGIPTTRALALTASPAPVRRETLETAAVVTRVAPSFIRFGHFEHFCHHDQHDDLRTLADFVIDRYYPQCRTSECHPNPYAALLAEVTARTARLMAQWQSVGFCHGVMNTDNMSILGLTIDYGPFQFLDAYNPAHICNHSDTQGRYAFHKQPAIAYWNLFCLGQAMLPLIEVQEDAIAALETFKTLYPQAFEEQMMAKLGFAAALPEPGHVEFRSLLEDGLKLLSSNRVDFTIFWRRLSHWTGGAGHAMAPSPSPSEAVRDLFLDRDAADAWLTRYARLIDAQPSAHDPALMLASNPHLVLRNHLGELAIRAAREGDFSKVHELQQVLQNPYDEHPDHPHLTGFAPEWASELEVSCSS